MVVVVVWQRGKREGGGMGIGGRFSFSVNGMNLVLY